MSFSLALYLVGIVLGHDKTFEALYENLPLPIYKTPEEMAEFLATQGVDKDKFLATFNSFAIKGQVTQARELAKKYEITGVPTMVVNGKYRFDIGSAGGAEQALQLADKLVEQERAANKAAAN